MARAGTPQPVIASLARQMKSASEDDAVRDRLKALFVQIEYAGPGEFAQRLEAETKLYGDVIRAAKIKLE
jgi:tripartite-type tricarboxylate transporter receptor subunit TctC